MLLGPVGQQRDGVDGGQRDAESGVGEQLLPPRRKRGDPRAQRPRKPVYGVHALMVRPAARTGDQP